jgi:hypothetical protein
LGEVISSWQAVRLRTPIEAILKMNIVSETQNNKGHNAQQILDPTVPLTYNSTMLSLLCIHNTHHDFFRFFF